MANLAIFCGMDLPNALDKDEILKLFKEYKDGSFTARNKKLEHNMRLVASIVSNKIYAEYADKDELFSVGCGGLIKAVDTFDLTKNIVFSTYATKCIYNEIVMYFRKNKNDKYLISMETVISSDINGKEKKLGDVLFSPDDLVVNYENKEMCNIIKEKLEKLDNRSKMIIKLYYGFEGEKKYTQEELAEKFGISRTYVCSIINSNLEKWRKELNDVNSAEKEKKKIERKRKKLSEYLGIDNEILKVRVKSLTDEEKQLLLMHYTKGFNNLSKSVLTKEQKKYLHDILFPKLKGKVLKKRNTS